MAKVRPITIYETISYVKTEAGGYAMERTGERVIPAHLTMHALHFGQREQFFESSILGEISQNLDEYNALKLLYIACEGANPGFHKEYPFEKFVQHVAVDLHDVQYTAQSLLIDSFPDTKTEWVAEMERLTREADGDEKK